MTGSLGNFAVQDADADCQPVIIIHGGYVRSYFDCTASDTKGGLLMVVSFYNFDIRTLVAGEVLESTLAKQKQPDPVHGTFLHSIMCGNDVFPPKVPGYWDTCVEAERISVSVEAEDEEFLTLRYHGSHLELGAIEGVVAIPKER